MKKDIHLDNIITHTIQDTISILIKRNSQGYLELNDAKIVLKNKDSISKIPNAKKQTFKRSKFERKKFGQI